MFGEMTDIGKDVQSSRQDRALAQAQGEHAADAVGL